MDEELRAAERAGDWRRSRELRVRAGLPPSLDDRVSDLVDRWFEGFINERNAHGEFTGPRPDQPGWVRQMADAVEGVRALGPDGVRTLIDGLDREDAFARVALLVELGTVDEALGRRIIALPDDRSRPLLDALGSSRPPWAAAVLEVACAARPSFAYTLVDVDPLAGLRVLEGFAASPERERRWLAVNLLGHWRIRKAGGGARAADALARLVEAGEPRAMLELRSLDATRAREVAGRRAAAGLSTDERLLASAGDGRLLVALRPDLEPARGEPFCQAFQRLGELGVKLTGPAREAAIAVAARDPDEALALAILCAQRDEPHAPLADELTRRLTAGEQVARAIRLGRHVLQAWELRRAVRAATSRAGPEHAPALVEALAGDVGYQLGRRVYPADAAAAPARQLADLEDLLAPLARAGEAGLAALARLASDREPARAAAGALGLWAIGHWGATKARGHVEERGGAVPLPLRERRADVEAIRARLRRIAAPEGPIRGEGQSTGSPCARSQSSS